VSAFKAGDLVMVVKPTPCCGMDMAIGHIFVVHDLGVTDKHTCWYCDAKSSGFLVARTGVVKNSINEAFRVSRLRLIPPLSDDETTEREVEHAA
jgi:hypothetical protein